MTRSEFYAELLLELIKLYGSSQPMATILKTANEVYEDWEKK